MLLYIIVFSASKAQKPGEAVGVQLGTRVGQHSGQIWSRLLKMVKSNKDGELGNQFDLQNETSYGTSQVKISAFFRLVLLHPYKHFGLQISIEAFLARVGEGSDVDKIDLMTRKVLNLQYKAELIKSCYIVKALPI